MPTAITTTTPAQLATSDVFDVVSYASPDLNPAIAYLAQLQSDGSKRKMRAALDEIASLIVDGADHQALNWYAVRLQHANAVRAHLAKTVGAATANMKLSALRGTLKMAVSLLSQVTTSDQSQALQVIQVKEALRSTIDGIKRITGDKPDQAAGRQIQTGELSALFMVCSADDGPAGDRDAAIIALAYSGGLRRSEIASLMLDSYDPATSQLTVTGKRNKTRTVYVDASATVLNDWLALRGQKDGPLFTRIRKGGHTTALGLTDQAIYGILQKRAEQAGVDKFSPHDFRRTFAGDMLDAGVDLATVQKIMGHASTTTTAGYDRRGERAKKNAAGKLHVPWHQRRTREASREKVQAQAPEHLQDFGDGIAYYRKGKGVIHIGFPNYAATLCSRDAELMERVQPGGKICSVCLSRSTQSWIKSWART